LPSFKIRLSYLNADRFLGCTEKGYVSVTKMVYKTLLASFKVDKYKKVKERKRVGLDIEYPYRLLIGCSTAPKNSKSLSN